jgi:hypothetical protein
MVQFASNSLSAPTVARLPIKKWENSKGSGVDCDNAIPHGKTEPQSTSDPYTAEPATDVRPTLDGSQVRRLAVAISAALETFFAAMVPDKFASIRSCQIAMLRFVLTRFE